jgi:hypothetical protein
VLIDEYARNLTFLADPKFIGRFLDTGSRQVLQEAVGILRSQRRATTWNFRILRNRPLTFRENSQKLQVDVAAIIDGKGDQVTYISTLLRVWCLDKSLCYRENLDADLVGTRFDETGRRVLARFHFDRRSAETVRPEPIYHLQVGGVPLDDENYWLPKQLKVPRFYFPPMDVILLCELILVNFFHEDSRDLREKPEWKRLVMKSQATFQRSYFDEFDSYVNSTTNTILGRLIS